MNIKLGIALSALLLAGACQDSGSTNATVDTLKVAAAPAQANLTPSAEDIEAHMRFLADDALEGREAGTEGYDAAAAYVAEQLEDLGVAPAGTDGSYFQTVPLQRSYRVPEALSFAVTDTATGAELSFENNVDHVVVGSSRAAESSVTAEAVFVGFGIVAPDLGRDDYAGLDVDGKVVVMLGGTPKGIQSEERAYYGSRKTAEASKRGAVGIVNMATPTREQVYSFARLVGEGRLEAAGMNWLRPDGDTYTLAPGIQAGATLSMEGGRKLIEAAGRDFDALMETAEAEGGAVQGFALPQTISISQTSTLDVVESDNVIGMIEGSDPVLKNEIIVLTAHLDHIGISKSFEEDKINNGALDNAAGVSTLLDVARMVLTGERPRRSIMVLIVTAEEKGLLGAEYFAQNPTVDASRLVGNVNLDMPVLTYPFQDVVAFGSDRSTMASAVASAAAEMDMKLSPDPFPDQGVFTRSDHFRMVEIGVPAIFLATGFENGGEEAWATHFAKNYHRPSDEIDNGIDFESAARFSEVNARIALELANRDERPLWLKDDFFARQFNGPQTAE